MITRDYPQHFPFPKMEPHKRIRLTSIFRSPNFFGEFYLSVKECIRLITVCTNWVNEISRCLKTIDWKHCGNVTAYIWVICKKRKNNKKKVQYEKSYRIGIVINLQEVIIMKYNIEMIWLVSLFNGISTFVSYLMPKPFT